jgi:gliding motility-associated-like protein
VTVTDGNNCSAVDTVTVPNAAPPIADFTFERAISCEGVTYQFTNTSIDALTYEWNIPDVGSSTDANPSFIFPYSGTYNVTLIVTNPPCKDTLTVPVVVGDLGTDMVFKDANVFTPNDDGLNDCFHPAMINMITGLSDEVLLPCIYLQVFDRWGVKMYESLGVNGKNCWNGQTQNDSKPALDGTYFWIATLGNTTLKGYVTLARHK